MEITFELSDERGDLLLRQSRLNSNSLCNSLLILRLIDLKNVDCSTLIVFFLDSAKYNDLPDLGRNNHFLVGSEKMILKKVLQLYL